MHRCHLHQVAVVFQAHAVGVGDLVLAAALDRGLEPAHQALAAEHLVLGLLQALGDVQVVGHAALAVDARQHARGRLLQQRLQHRLHAHAAPVDVRRLETLGPGRPLALVGLERDQVAQPEAEQRRDQRPPQAHRIERRGHGLQQPQHLARRFGGEHALLVDAHGRHVGRDQRRLHRGRLAVGVDQDGDIARRQWPFRSVVVLELAGFEQGGDAVDGRVLDAPLQRALVGIAVVRDRPGGHAGEGAVGRRQLAVAGGAGGVDVQEVDAVDHERPVAAGREQGIEAAHHGRRRAMVRLHAVTAVGVLGRIEIGKHVAAAEGVPASGRR